MDECGVQSRARNEIPAHFWMYRYFDCSPTLQHFAQSTYSNTNTGGSVRAFIPVNDCRSANAFSSSLWYSANAREMNNSFLHSFSPSLTHTPAGASYKSSTCTHTNGDQRVFNIIRNENDMCWVEQEQWSYRHSCMASWGREEWAEIDRILTGYESGSSASSAYPSQMCLAVKRQDMRPLLAQDFSLLWPGNDQPLIHSHSWHSTLQKCKQMGKEARQMQQSADRFMYVLPY